jgi:hypothetical protein
MKMRVLRWFVALCWVLFFGTIPVMYFFAQIASNRIVSLSMYFVGLLVVAPSFVWLLVYFCRHGLTRCQPTK